ncbi:MAG: DNA repair protein RecO [Winogradskyella sp.]|nr:DNA repair protein RecO [Winogradskyella sp.]
MLSKNKCIVLSKLKYRDNDLIIRCYSLQRGTISYLVRGAAKSKKSASKMIYFQLLSQIETEDNYKPNKSLQYFKEVKLSYLYKSLHTNVFKSAIAIFLAEILNSILIEEESNEELFVFIETALQYLDTTDHYSNFHLLFLIKLTRFLGIQPQQLSTAPSHFDLQTGTFENKAHGLYCIEGKNLDLLITMLGTNFDALHSIKITANQRQEFLGIILQYFELHLGGFKKPQSLQIFNDVFH